MGALLDARAVHGGRTARDHLLWLAQANRLPRRRVARSSGWSAWLRWPPPDRGFSLGMAQRLGIAAALLGDPGVVIFDEPVNGLDPDGVLWIRDLLRDWPRRAGRCWSPAT